MTVQQHSENEWTAGPAIRNWKAIDVSIFDAAKFWSLVKTGAANDCWEWQGGTTRAGYGRLSIKRSPYAAHRVALALSGTAVPQHLLVCHHCDNPPCCNPNHLFLGTDMDNTADRLRKGRRLQFSGSNNPKAILTPEQVIEIRKSLLSNTDLGRFYGVDRKTVRDARTGRTWGLLS